MPERPGKLLGTVLRLFFSVAGAWPMPMHPLQPAWWMRPPARMSLSQCPCMVKVFQDLPRSRVDVKGDPVVHLLSVHNHRRRWQNRGSPDLPKSQSLTGKSRPGHFPDRNDIVRGCVGRRSTVPVQKLISSCSS